MRALWRGVLDVKERHNMGTRAMISFDGKPTIATHWDGDPDCMGQHLLACRDMVEILAVANR